MPFFLSIQRAGKILKKEELDWEEMKAALDKLAELQKEAGPSVFLLYVKIQSYLINFLPYFPFCLFDRSLCI